LSPAETAKEALALKLSHRFDLVRDRRFRRSVDRPHDAQIRDLDRIDIKAAKVIAAALS